MIHTQTHSLLYTHTWQCVARVQADGAEVCFWNVPLHFFFYVHFFPFLLRTQLTSVTGERKCNASRVSSDEVPAPGVAFRPHGHSHRTQTPSWKANREEAANVGVSTQS